MNTSKPKQQLRDLPASLGSTPTPGAGDNSGCTEPLARNRQDSFELPDAPCDSGESIARVTAVDRGHCMIRDAKGEVPAKQAGKNLYRNDSPVNLPCVGDWVRVRYHDSGAHASILGVLPRKSFLSRKKPGSTIDRQMIAANIDVAFIVQSCHFDFNVRRLERYLVMTSEGHIEPVVLLTKTDLVSPETVEELVLKIRNAGIGARVITLSNVGGDGFDQFRESILPGKTYCLLGSSGVGKTTLVNRLTGNSNRATRTVSDSGEGRHTTTRRQLNVLENGGFLVDMPGMRELGMLGVRDGINDSFADVQELALNCRFSDCTHTSEPGCAIRESIAKGETDAAHFGSYQKLKKESDFLDLSYHQKRQKDRDFGKHVRSVMKSKGKHDE